MIIRKTVRDYHEKLYDGSQNKGSESKTHTVMKIKSTWWFLFIPVLSYETLKYSNLH